MYTTSLFRHFMITVGISVAVYLFMTFLLPYLFPFLLAYILMRMLWPVMEYLHNVCKFPRFFSHYGTLILFFGGISAFFGAVIYKLYTQIRLLFTNIPVYQQTAVSFFETRCASFGRCIDHHFNLHFGTAKTFLYEQMALIGKNTTKFMNNNIWKCLYYMLSQSFHIFAFLIIVCVSMIILVREMKPLHDMFRKSRYFTPVHFILTNVKESGLTYLKTEGIILLLNGIVCSLAFFLIHNPYFLLLGVAIAVLDAFPVLGSGMFLLPWGFFLFLSKEYLNASILFTAYIITLLIREILEARMLGDGMHLNAFVMLAAIFIGIELFGIGGILLGPLSLVLIRSLLQLASP